MRSTPLFSCCQLWLRVRWCSRYRNPIDEVVRFLEERHADRYKVFNLCNERTYDISKFGAACAAFPFDDHGAPPLALVSAFCASCKAWLLQGLDHVVAVSLYTRASGNGKVMVVGGVRLPTSLS